MTLNNHKKVTWTTFLLIILAVSVVSVSFGLQSSSIISTTGMISYASARVFGWGGYIPEVEQVIPILDNLAAGRYTAVRYWARPYWLYGESPYNLNFNVLDHLVEEAAKRNIVVYIDCEHNYPPSQYINETNKEIWVNEVIEVGLRYKDKFNVVLEPVSEYTGSDQVDLYNWAMTRIRAAGIHLPLLWNFWWNQKNVVLNDPDNNYAIGRHLYGSAYNDYNPPTPMSLEDAVQESGIKNAMYHYFYDTSQTFYLQEVIKLGIPNGWVISELGPTDNESLVGNPSVGNMAYAMQFLREAASNNVSVICYRIGSFSTKSLYEQKALEYFQESYFMPP